MLRVAKRIDTHFRKTKHAFVAWAVWRSSDNGILRRNSQGQQQQNHSTAPTIPPPLVVLNPNQPPLPPSILLPNPKLIHNNHNPTIPLISNQAHQPLPNVLDLVVLVQQRDMLLDHSVGALQRCGQNLVFGKRQSCGWVGCGEREA